MTQPDGDIATTTGGLLDQARRRFVPIATPVAVLLTLAAGAAMVSNTWRARAAYGWIEHTQQVQRHLEATDAQVQHLGAGARGFVVTGETEFLPSVEVAREGLARELLAL